MSNSAKLIYGIFKFNDVNSSDTNKNPLFKEYDNLVRVSVEPDINRKGKFDLGMKFNKNRLTKLIKIINKKSINLNIAFNEFNLDSKYKKYFAQPNNIDFNAIRDDSDNKFLTMVLTLLYHNESDKYHYTIKDVIDKLDKSKINLVVLTSCLHAKNVLMKIYQQKESIPTTLTEYNKLSGQQVTPGEYFENSTYLPKYYVTDYERQKAQRFKEIYSQWETNQQELINLVEEELTGNAFTEDGSTGTILFNCVYNNYHQVLSLLRKNIGFTSDELVVSLERILDSDLSSPNQALNKFLKIKFWHHPENIKIRSGYNFLTLYQLFENKNKKSLWECLIMNKFEWYKYDQYNTWLSENMGDKIMNRESDSMFPDINERLRLLKLFYTNSTVNLLEQINSNTWKYSDIIMERLNQLDYILANNIDRNNLGDLFNKIYNEQLVKAVINSCIKYGYFSMSPSNATKLLITLADNQFKLDVSKFMGIIQGLKSAKVDLNTPNEDGYNFYSYLIASKTCSIARTRFNEYNADVDKINQTIDEMSQNFTQQIEILESLGFSNNGRQINESLIPTDFKGLEYNLIIDGVKCKNFYG